MTRDGLTRLAQYFGALWRWHTNPAHLDIWEEFFADYRDGEILGAAQECARSQPERTPTPAMLRGLARDARGPEVAGRLTSSENADPRVSAGYTIREVPALADADHPFYAKTRPPGLEAGHVG
jgi:hypothetical protein